MWESGQASSTGCERMNRPGLEAGLGEHQADLAQVRGCAMSGGNPTLRQRELGSCLRKLRTDLGPTVVDVAEKLLCSTAKVSRLEKGAHAAALRDIRDLHGLYELDEAATADLMELANETRERDGGSSTRTSIWICTSGLNSKPPRQPDTPGITFTAWCKAGTTRRR